jgi:hypothetical protein
LSKPTTTATTAAFRSVWYHIKFRCTLSVEVPLPIVFVATTKMPLSVRGAAKLSSSSSIDVTLYSQDCASACCCAAVVPPIAHMPPFSRKIVTVIHAVDIVAVLVRCSVSVQALTTALCAAAVALLSTQLHAVIAYTSRLPLHRCQHHQQQHQYAAA